MRKLKQLLAAFMIAIMLICTAPVFCAPQLQASAASQTQSIKISKTKLTLYRTKSYTLKVKGTNKTVSWSSSDKKIVSVNKSGKIKAKRVGTAVITAKVDGKKLKCKVTVKAPLTASVSSLTLLEKQTKKIKITYALSGSVYWEVDDSSIVTCEWTKEWDGNTTKLKIKGLKAGKTTVTISNDKTSDIIRIPVTVKFDGIAIEVAKTNITLEPRQTEIVRVTINENNDSYDLDYSVQNSDIVAVDVDWISTKKYNVELTGKKQGTTTVTLSNPDTGSKVTLTVIVKLNGPALTVDATSVEVNAGISKTLNIKQKEDGDLSCSSSNTSIAKAEISGWGDNKKLEITGVNAGSATITVKNDATGSTAKVFVTVKTPIIINLPETPILLHEYSYDKETVMQTYWIDDITYEIGRYDSSEDDYTVYLYFGGEKTYDYRGSGQSTSAKIGWKLYDEDCTVVTSDTCYSPTVAAGDSWKAANAKDYIWDLKAGTYNLVILSVD